jgi:tRNA nucleotidyltransferase (CCA-adding enzyme)
MRSHIEVFEVGGSLRDRFLGIESQDRDFCVIAPSFEAMTDYVVEQGGTVFLSKPEFFTLRVKMPNLGACDFVLARRDGNYRDGRRPEEVFVAESIEQELARRDATVNAIARNMVTNEIIDPFNGVSDIQARILRAVGDPFERFNEDRLRILRFMRFAVTKGFVIESFTACAMRTFMDLTGVSTERIREELLKMFGKDTSKSLQVLDQFPLIKHYVLTKTDIWLKPTTEQY